MSLAYVVTQGQYSDYGITGAFSSFEKARQFCIDEIHEATLMAMQEAIKRDDSVALCRWFRIDSPLTIEIYEQDTDDPHPGEDRMTQMYPQPDEDGVRIGWVR